MTLTDQDDQEAIWKYQRTRVGNEVDRACRELFAEGLRGDSLRMKLISFIESEILEADEYLNTTRYDESHEDAIAYVDNMTEALERVKGQWK